jgi:hypothetical protein
MPPPPGHKWAGDWKIDVTSNSADGRHDGWLFLGRAGGKRRRWLREVTLDSGGAKEKVSGPYVRMPVPDAPLIPSRPPPPPPPPPSAKSLAVTSSRLSSLSTLATAIADDFTFKGFGLSIYKSFLDRHAAGASFRLPITQNFITLYERPWIPSVGVSAGFYNPTSVGIFLNISMPIQVILHFLRRIFAATIFLLTLQRQTVSPMRYNDEIIQRLGLSFSWRYSNFFGYRFIAAPWIMFLPNVLFLKNKLLAVARSALEEIERRHTGVDNKVEEKKMEEEKTRRRRKKKKAEDAIEENGRENDVEGIESDDIADADTDTDVDDDDDDDEDAEYLKPVLSTPTTTLQTLLTSLDAWLLASTAGLGGTLSLHPDGVTGSVVMSANGMFCDGASNMVGKFGRGKKRKGRKGKKKDVPLGGDY